MIVASSGVDSEVTNRLVRDLVDPGMHVELSSTLRDISRSGSPSGHSAGSRSSTSSPWRGQLGARRRSGHSTSPSPRWAWCALPIRLIAAIAIRARLQGVGLLQPGPRRHATASRSACSSCAPWSSTPSASGDAPRQQRGRRSPLQVKDDPRITRVGRLLRSLDRRAASVGERPPWRDEHRRAPPGATARSRGVGLALSRSAGQARPHRHVAGPRPQRRLVRGLRAPRPVLRRQLVARHGPGDPGQDHPGGLRFPARQPVALEPPVASGQASTTTRAWSTRLSASGPASVATTMSSRRRPQRPAM